MLVFVYFLSSISLFANLGELTNFVKKFCQSSASKKGNWPSSTSRECTMASKVVMNFRVKIGNSTNVHNLKKYFLIVIILDISYNIIYFFYILLYMF